MEYLKYVLIVVGALALIGLIYYLIKRFVKRFIKVVTRVYHLNMRKRGYTEMPAVPFILRDVIETVVRLGLRVEENKMAKQGLSNPYILQKKTHSAYTYMYDDATHDPGRSEREELIQKLENSSEEALLATGHIHTMMANAAHPINDSNHEKLTQLFLEEPEQFTISWTNFGGRYSRSLPKVKTYADVLTNANAATEQFWPMIAEHGFAYNLLILAKVEADQMGEIHNNFGDVKKDDLIKLQTEGRLYSIDLRIFENWDSQTVKDFQRWTPAAWILLEQDPANKKLKPILVRISGKEGSNAHVYHSSPETDSTWIFALLAARTAVTVYGIWLGHVYHWHMVTAATQMTMVNTMKKDHPIRKLMDPQSKSLIGFNDTLLLLWSTIGPPTSFSTTDLFLQLTNTFATNRKFFDDDPDKALKNLGLKKEDFSDKTDWDRYPLVKNLLYFWNISGNFADAFVSHTYNSDLDVSNDKPLQNWIKESGNPEEGNIRGLPEKLTKSNLKEVLQSLIYRVVVHGNSRQLNSLDAALSFISNYPPCLQNSNIPSPKEDLKLSDIMRYLPNTGTIGEMMTFYYIFVYSAPTNSLLPLLGNKTSLYFDGQDDPRNIALIAFRDAVGKFVKDYDKESPLVHQWPASIET